MPLKLTARKDSPNLWIRGTYLGVPVNRSAGTAKRSVANRELKKEQERIERGEIAGGETFLSAVAAYIKGGGEKRYLRPLVEYFGAAPLASIDQTSIDQAAADLYPPGVSERPSPHNATLNRQIYTPVSAILRAVGHSVPLKRPKQPQGRLVWIEPREAGVWLDAADTRLRRLSMHLLYTGCRVTESCDVRGRDRNLGQRMIYVGETKNGEPRAVHIPPVLLSELRLIQVKPDERLYGYRDRWDVYDDWNPLRERLGFPDWWTPHAACHTWATWMRQFAGRDLRGLLGTGRWRDLKSVLRYQHVVTTEESRAADLLPDLVNQSEENPDEIQEA